MYLWNIMEWTGCQTLNIIIMYNYGTKDDDRCMWFGMPLSIAKWKPLVMESWLQSHISLKCQHSQLPVFLPNVSNMYGNYNSPPAHTYQTISFFKIFSSNKTFRDSPYCPDHIFCYAQLKFQTLLGQPCYLPRHTVLQILVQLRSQCMRSLWIVFMTDPNKFVTGICSQSYQHPMKHITPMN